MRCSEVFQTFAARLAARGKAKGVIIGAVMRKLLHIVYGVLNSTVFSAKSVAQSYLTAIADGKYDKANDIADPQVGKDQLKLLSDTVAKADNATIATIGPYTVELTVGTDLRSRYVVRHGHGGLVPTQTGFASEATFNAESDAREHATACFSALLSGKPTPFASRAA